MHILRRRSVPASSQIHFRLFFDHPQMTEDKKQLFLERKKESRPLTHKENISLKVKVKFSLQLTKQGQSVFFPFYHVIASTRQSKL